MVAGAWRPEPGGRSLVAGAFGDETAGSRAGRVCGRAVEHAGWREGKRHAGEVRGYSRAGPGWAELEPPHTHPRRMKASGSS